MSIFSTPVTDTETLELNLKRPYFISDLHLDVNRQKDFACFSRFIREHQENFDELVILGDFFDYWVGDDAIDTAHDYIEVLRELSKNKKLFIMHGNRDFMLGGEFAKTIGATLLTDPTRAVIGDKHYLLSHGDIWCTRDSDYQKVRARVRSFAWQWFVLRLPLAKRLDIARNARNKSHEKKMEKPVEAMDVVNEAILDHCSKETIGIIHGHTHRPGQYCVSDTVNRWVIPDWRHGEDNDLTLGFIAFENGEPCIEMATYDAKEIAK